MNNSDEHDRKSGNATQTLEMRHTLISSGGRVPRLIRGMRIGNGEANFASRFSRARIIVVGDAAIPDGCREPASGRTFQASRNHVATGVGDK